MYHHIKAQVKDVFMARLDYGADLFDTIVKLAKDQQVRLGKVEAVGAVKKAKIGFYHQDEKKYEEVLFDRPLEITSLIGNLSIRDNDVAFHAHVNLGEGDGKVIGGHLLPGTIVFACEVTLFRFEGPDLVRQFDEVTGLHLWGLEEPGKIRRRVIGGN
jgi:uncharacterized protein